jgi:hypothetical protein
MPIEDAFTFRPIDWRSPDIAELECLIEQRDLRPVLAGQALALIRDRQLYRANRRYASFAHYCQAALGLTPNTVQVCMEAADLAEEHPELEGLSLAEFSRRKPFWTE